MCVLITAYQYPTPFHCSLAPVHSSSGLLPSPEEYQPAWEEGRGGGRGGGGEDSEEEDVEEEEEEEEEEEVYNT